MKVLEGGMEPLRGMALLVKNAHSIALRYKKTEKR